MEVLCQQWRVHLMAKICGALAEIVELAKYGKAARGGVIA
jgi:hypothetical protein